MNGLKTIWSAAKGALLALLVIITSMGAVNCSWAFSALHGIDPEKYGTENIYWVAGVINFLVCGYFLWRRYIGEKKMEEK